MSTDAIKHNIKWNTRAGDLYRKTLTLLGLRLLRAGRKLLKRSLSRCSWCGADCGFASAISQKGKRCSSLHRNCVDKPGV